MLRKVFWGAIVAAAGALLALSLLGIGVVWGYNETVTRQADTRLQDLDGELESAHLALDVAITELRRALRILDGAQTALQTLSRSTSQARQALEAVGGTLDESVIPGLRTTREQLRQVSSALEAALTALETLNSLSVLPVPIPGEEWLSGLLEATRSLDAEIVRIEEVANTASTFLSDLGYVLGGDFGETERGLNRLLQTVTEYRTKIQTWRALIATTRADLPTWIDRTSALLTVVLLWSGLSQGGLILHGLAGYRGEDPFRLLRGHGASPGR